MVIVVATATMLKGVQVVRFEAASFATSGPSRDAVLASSEVLGLRGRAARAVTPSYALEQAAPEAIENVLLVEPTNGIYWLALAEGWQDEGAAQEKVLSALRMSEVVQPREAVAMARRAAFVLSLWDEMPVTERGRATTDLVELGARLPGDDRSFIAGILKGKPDEVRSSVRAALRQKSVDSRELADFGL